MAAMGWVGRVGPGDLRRRARLHCPADRPRRVLFTQREDFTGVAVPFYEHWLRADALPQFRAMTAALARQAAGS
jgi:hypothetical protein